MTETYDPKPRRWNGYGLSFFKCKCGSARKVMGATVKADMLHQIHATPCKRCGSTDEPVGWPSDPWEYFTEPGA